MTNTSNIIVVDGHTYTWEWNVHDPVLLSELKTIVFMMAGYDFLEDAASRAPKGFNTPYLDLS